MLTSALPGGVAAPPTFPRVLLVHNRYLLHGGEDTALEAHVALIEQYGGRAFTHIAESQDAEAMADLKRHPLRLVYNRAVFDAVRARIRAERIDLVHCHNLFPLLSTSVYAAAQAEGVPVVQSVHNFRTACLSGFHLRDGKPCHQCRPGFHLPAVVHACYRGSRTQSAALGIAQSVNKWRGAWQLPALYIVQSVAMLDDVLSWGIPRERVYLMAPWIAVDPGSRQGPGQYAAYLGRLSVEKGLDVLLDAWRVDDGPLMIIGDGPDRSRLEQRVRDSGLTNVTFTGFQQPAQVRALLHGARFLVVPSLMNEPFGLVAPEAFAHGVPALVSAAGALPTIVRHGETGFVFPRGDARALGQRIQQLAEDPVLLERMSQAARREYERHYAVEAGAHRLSGAYKQALATRRTGEAPSSSEGEIRDGSAD